MALDYIDIYKLSEDTNFQRRVQVALWREATLAKREDAATPNHAARANWATRELRGANPNIKEACLRIMTSGQVFANGAAATDAQIQAAVGAIIDDLALGE